MRRQIGVRASRWCVGKRDSRGMSIYCGVSKTVSIRERVSCLVREIKKTERVVGHDELRQFGGRDKSGLRSDDSWSTHI